MNDKTTKNIIIITISSVVAALFIWAAIATACAAVSNRKYDKLVAQHRQLVTESRIRNEQYAEVYRTARETNRAVGESLSRCQYSISELRAAMQLIREKYQEMENLLYSVDSSECNTTDNSNSDISD